MACLVSVSSFCCANSFLDSSLHVDQVLTYPSVHEARYSTLVHFQLQTISPHSVECFFQVNPDCECMLFVLESIFNFLGNGGHLIFCGSVLSEASFLRGDDLLLLQVLCQSGVDQPFHQFANTAC